jgi:hypothetical protein
MRGRGLGREYVITYRITSRPTRRSPPGGYTNRPPLARCRSSENGRAGRRPGRRPHALRRARPPDRGDGDEHPRGRVGGCPERRLHVRVPPGALAEAPHSYIGVTRGPADLAARGRLQYDWSSGYPNVSVGRRARGGDRSRASSTTSCSAITIVGGIALLSGVLILVGAGGDDEVPAHLRGRHPPHARREHADADDHAGARILHARACWPAPSAPRARWASAGRSPATSSRSPGARTCPRGRHPPSPPRSSGDWRGRQRRRPAQQAARTLRAE